MRRLPSALIAAALIAPLAAGSAAAQPAAPPPPAKLPPPVAPVPAPVPDVDKAAELLSKGRELAAAGNCEGAIPPLRGALAIKKDWATAAELATCEAKLDQLLDAAEHLSFVLRMQPAEDHPADRKKSLALYEKIRAQIAGVTIAGGPEGADVFVNDRLVGQAPLGDFEVFAKPGVITVSAKKVGFREFTATLRLRAGEAGKVKIDLDRPPPEQLFNEGPTRVPIYVLGGAALIAGGVGAGLMISAGSKSASADDKLAALKTQGDNPCAVTKDVPKDCAVIKQLRTDRDQLVNIGTGVLIGAGVLAVGAIGYAVYARKATNEAPQRVSLVPVISPNTNGLWLRGAF